MLKYEVDGSKGPLAAGQDLAAAAYEAHMSFASYLASRALSVDVWDGESLLQVWICLGAAAITLFCYACHLSLRKVCSQQCFAQSLIKDCSSK